MGPGTLWLIPCTLGGGDPAAVIPQRVAERVRALRYFLAEEPKTARAFLKTLGHPGPITGLRIERLNHNAADVEALLAPVREGADAGVLSEAGCPAVADPGSDVVLLAHRYGIRVVPLVGPSSIVLALMASGLEAQHFAFHGYLPIKEPDRARSIRALEERSRKGDETEIFIETPYRNAVLLRALVSSCRADTWLCVASDLTLPTESVVTRRIAAWRATQAHLDRRPSVFLLRAE